VQYQTLNIENNSLIFEVLFLFCSFDRGEHREVLLRNFHLHSQTLMYMTLCGQFFLEEVHGFTLTF